jgi:hypothetical protein
MQQSAHAITDSTAWAVPAAEEEAASAFHHPEAAVALSEPGPAASEPRQAVVAAVWDSRQEASSETRRPVAASPAA